jgi:hypothetical protein
LKTHALQEGLFRSGEPDEFNSWKLGDPGPPKEQEGFSDEEFQQLFASSRPAWLEAHGKGDVEAMWHLLEGVLCQRHRARCEQFQRPAVGTVWTAEEPQRKWHQGDLCSRKLTEATRRKRRLRQWLSLSGRPECAPQRRSLRQVLVADAGVEQASVAMLELPTHALGELADKAKVDEDTARAGLRDQRRQGWRQWCQAESTGSMRALFRWVRNGPRSMQSTGIFTKQGRLCAGQKALLEASEQAWWPLWQQLEGPRWERVAKPRLAEGAADL